MRYELAISDDKFIPPQMYTVYFEASNDQEAKERVAKMLQLVRLTDPVRVEL